MSTPAFLKRPREILSPAEKRQLTAGFGTPIRSAPKRSRWKPLLVIAALLAGAIALGALTGCTSPHGPEMLPGTMPLPDGSRLAAFDAISRPDKWGLAATDGVGLLRIGPDGHTTVEGWSTTQGPSDAGIALQLAAGVAGSIGGGAISGGLTERGLNTVASAVSTMKVPTPTIDLGMGSPKSVTSTSVAGF